MTDRKATAGARARAARYWRGNVALVSVLLAFWFFATFGVSSYARELSRLDFFSWPFSYWVGAQGALLVYLTITVLYAIVMNRRDRRIRHGSADLAPVAADPVEARWRRSYLLYSAGFIVFVLVLAWLERRGMARHTIGYVFLGATVIFYAAIGIATRTSDPVEFYVAGRRVPAMFNGMATAADWMSAASFISLAGGLYSAGYQGLAFVMGWTGGYVLVALLLAPYLRSFGEYTIPDFLGARFGGHIPRLIGIAITILCSFTYLVAQIYGVGLITSRLTGVEFQIGIFLGLGGVLVCSFLGGMRAVTWTQVSQFTVLIIAYMVPVVWLSIIQTGNPVPQLAYGSQLKQVTQIEENLIKDRAENDVRRIFRERADSAKQKLIDPQTSFEAERSRLASEVAALSVDLASDAELRAAERALLRFPVDVAGATALWQSELRYGARGEQIVRHGEPYPGADPQERDVSRRNFLALMFCLMIGTAALPHILVRYYTTPSVETARNSAGWSLAFISLLYLSAPALAVLVKFTIYSDVVGASFSELPAWIRQWQLVDEGLISLEDVNLDGIVQLAELYIGSDIIVLAAPEIAGMPYVVSGLVAAGGMAAALSTADGLLLTISNALSHDLYYRVINPDAATGRRITLSKVLLLFVAMSAAFTAAQRPADILFLVAAAFSFAAAGFFPVLILGIFWKRATGLGAVCGMLGGLGTTFAYMALNQPWLRELIFGIPRTAPIDDLIWSIDPIAAGVFGVPVGFLLAIAVSLFTPQPSAATERMVDAMRYPMRERQANDER